MPTTEPLTGATIPVGSDAPDIAAIVTNAVNGVADNTIPFFTSTALRDSAYSTWVAAGGAMRNGLTCHVGTTRYVYISGAWVADVIGYQNKMMRASRIVSTSFGTGDTTWLAFASNTNWTETDPWNMRGTGGTIVAPFTGWYDMGGGITFAANVDGSRGLRLNPQAGLDIGRGSGLPMYLGQQRASTSGIGTTINGSITAALTAGQTVTLEAMQNSGAALNVDDVWLFATYTGPNT